MAPPVAVEPTPTGVRFPDPATAGPREIVAVGEDFRPGTLLTAYRAGIFPWPHEIDGEMIVAWFSPLRRTVLPLDSLRWSRSLRRLLRKHPYRITVDRAFREVMLACGAQREHGTWIIPSLVDGYVALHELGWAHSLEVWSGDELVGGIYGVAIGGAMCCESMFHRRTDASKIAFATLALQLRDSGYLVFDAQVMSPHLASLGCVDIPRSKYLRSLAAAIAAAPRPPINAW
jgi:leucyl/phenylalanyl-tRNA---protein transferase